MKYILPAGGPYTGRMTLDELVRRAREAAPRDAADPAALLEWRGRVYSIRHTLPDGSRGAEVADALAALIGSAVRLATDDADPMVELQEHVWCFSRIKGNTTDEATEAAEEIQRRLVAGGRRRVVIASIYRMLMGAEFDLLASAVRGV